MEDKTIQTPESDTEVQLPVWCHFDSKMQVKYGWLSSTKTESDSAYVFRTIDDKEIHLFGVNNYFDEDLINSHEFSCLMCEEYNGETYPPFAVTRITDQQWFVVIEVNKRLLKDKRYSLPIPDMEDGKKIFLSFVDTGIYSLPLQVENGAVSFAVNNFEISSLEDQDLVILKIGEKTFAMMKKGCASQYRTLPWPGSILVNYVKK